MQVLVPTKSLSHLQFSFDSMRDAYHLYGHEMLHIFFTDNVDGDEKFLEKALPSLTLGVERVDMSVHKNLEIATLPSNVTVHLLACPEVVNRAMNIILEEVENKDSITMGFDCEWNYDPITGIFPCISIGYVEQWWYTI